MHNVDNSLMWTTYKHLRHVTDKVYNASIKLAKIACLLNICMCFLKLCASCHNNIETHRWMSTSIIFQYFIFFFKIYEILMNAKGAWEQSFLFTAMNQLQVEGACLSHVAKWLGVNQEFCIQSSLDLKSRDSSEAFQSPGNWPGIDPRSRSDACSEEAARAWSPI